MPQLTRQQADAIAAQAHHAALVVAKYATECEERRAAAAFVERHDSELRWRWERDDARALHRSLIAAADELTRTGRTRRSPHEKYQRAMIENAAKKLRPPLTADVSVA